MEADSKQAGIADPGHTPLCFSSKTIPPMSSDYFQQHHLKTNLLKMPQERVVVIRL
jgi:hypothetical protein